MNPYVPRSSKAVGGFTLIEILVSVTILGLIMVGVTQMMNSAISAATGGYKHMDADTQARMVLDRMAYDISKITKRSDIDYYFNKNATSAGTTPGNDQMAFFCESGGYYPSSLSSSAQQSNVSLVGYMIAPTLNGTVNTSSSSAYPGLVRLSKGLAWSGANASYPGMVFNALPTNITNNTITSTWPLVGNGTDPDYQVIGDQVFRLEYTFLVQPPPTAPAPSASSPTTTLGGFSDSPWYAPDSTPNGLKDVTAIVVSIAVLDAKSRANVSSTALQTAASNLPDDNISAMTSGAASVEANLPLSLWKSNLNTAMANGTYLGLPKAAASQIRFYQRFCYLNHLQ